MNDLIHAAYRVPLSRRGLLLTAATGLITGCATDSMSLIASTLGTGRAGSRYPLSDEQIASIPYASLGVRIGEGAGVVMILASIEDGRLQWVSADRVVLVTCAGRLIKTVGLKRDLVGCRDSDTDAIDLAQRGDPAAAAVRVRRIVDLRPDDDFSVPVETRCDVQGEEVLTKLGVTHRVVRVRERVLVRKWRWSTENLYWFDQDSTVMWKSRQQFCPDVAPITMELLKPPTIGL